MFGPIDGAQISGVVGDDEHLADGRFEAINQQTQNFTRERQIAARKSNRFVPGIAKALKIAFEAARLARLTNAAAMPDELMGKKNPAILGNDFHQVLLDLFGIGILCQIKTLGKALDVRIDDDAGGDAEGRTENDVCGLARDAGKGKQFVHGLRDFAVEFPDDFFAGADDGFRFVAEKPRGANVIFELGGIRIGKILGRGIFREESLCDDIHALVRALRGKDCGDQQMKRAVVMQFACRCRISLIKLFENRADALRIRATSGG